MVFSHFSQVSTANHGWKPSLQFTEADVLIDLPDKETCMSIQEDLKSPGHFYVATTSRLLYMYKTRDGNWTTDLIVGNGMAECVDG